MAKKWSPVDDALLRELCGTGIPLTKRMHLFPGRSYEAVKIHASRIGVEYLGQCPWTKKEDSALRKIYESDESIKAGLRMLPRRTHAAAKARAHRLKLEEKTAPAPKAASWIKVAITRVLKDDVAMTAQEIARATGASRSAVMQLLALLHGKDFRVTDWEKTDFCHWSAMWSVGCAPDAIKPAPKSMREANKKAQSKKRILSATFNPFATAAGMIEAPKGETGRTYILLTDIRGEEREAA